MKINTLNQEAEKRKLEAMAMALAHEVEMIRADLYAHKSAWDKEYRGHYKKMARFERRMNDVRNNGRKNNIVIEGLVIKGSVFGTVVEFLEELVGFNIIPSEAIEQDADSNGKKRIVVKLEASEKSHVMKHKYKLDGGSVFISHDDTKDEESLLKKLRRKLRSTEDEVMEKLLDFKGLTIDPPSTLPLYLPIH